MGNAHAHSLDGRIGIEAASWRDLNALRTIERVCFPQDAWPLWDLIGILTLPNVVRLKALNAGEVVGFIGADVRAAENAAWIATLGVLPEHRRRGIGSALLRACEERLAVAAIRLCVRPSNQAAIRLYERSGYLHHDDWQKYYYDGENALVLEKKIKNRL